MYLIFINLLKKIHLWKKSESDSFFPVSRAKFLGCWVESLGRETQEQMTVLLEIAKHRQAKPGAEETWQPLRSLGCLTNPRIIVKVEGYTNVRRESCSSYWGGKGKGRGVLLISTSDAQWMQSLPSLYHRHKIQNAYYSQFPPLCSKFPIVIFSLWKLTLVD